MSPLKRSQIPALESSRIRHTGPGALPMIDNISPLEKMELLTHTDDEIAKYMVAQWQADIQTDLHELFDLLREYEIPEDRWYEVGQRFLFYFLKRHWKARNQHGN